MDRTSGVVVLLIGLLLTLFIANAIAGWIQRARERRIEKKQQQLGTLSSSGGAIPVTVVTVSTLAAPIKVFQLMDGRNTLGNTREENGNMCRAF